MTISDNSIIITMILIIKGWYSLQDVIMFSKEGETEMELLLPPPPPLSLAFSLSLSLSLSRSFALTLSILVNLKHDPFQ